MERIRIERNGQVLAHHTTATPLCHYGQAVWVVENKSPKPGPATWKQGAKEQRLDVLGVKDGWLLCRQRGGLLCGIIWSDGGYYADLLVDTKTQKPCKTLRKRGGQEIRGTIKLDPGPDDLGSILV